MRGLDTNARLKILSSKDIFIAIFLLLVGIFLLITGILVVIMAIDMISLMSQYSGYPYTPMYYNTLPWIFLMLGLGAIIYGIKRIIDDVLKIIILRNPPTYRQPPRSQQPISKQQVYPPSMENRENPR